MIDFDPVFKEASARVYRGDLQHVRYYDGWQDAVRYLREKVSMFAAHPDGDAPQLEVKISRIVGGEHWQWSIWREDGDDEWMLVHQGRPTLDFSEAETESREWLRNNP